MPKPTWNGHQITFNEVLEYANAVEKELTVRIRFSTVPLGRGGKQGTHAVLVTPYHPNGRKMAEVEAEQHLWPTAAFKSREALEMYLLLRLEQRLSEHEEHLARVHEQERESPMTPLEAYIARS